jgi:PTH1 family peptidyl-tRNA hydrolase
LSLSDKPSSENQPGAVAAPGATKPRRPFLVVGLGNPGLEYQWTPHNVGFLAIDRLAERAGARVDNRRCKALTTSAVLCGQTVVLAKPETFMNLSGTAVQALAREFEIDPARDMIVIYDELALPFGSMRVRERGSSAGHNGAKSITGVLQREDWPRIRIGVGPDPLGGREEARRSGKDYLLTPMKKQDLVVLDKTLDRVAEAVEMVMTRGVLAAMNAFNRREPNSPAGE